MKSKILFLSMLLISLQSANVFAMKRETQDSGQNGSGQPDAQHVKTDDPGSAEASTSSAASTTSAAVSAVTTVDIESFDDYLVLKIFSHLDLQSLCRMTQTCKRFNAGMVQIWG
jgi:hypothetical protein